MDCKFLDKCPFFTDKMADKPGLSALMKRTYCQGAPETCARLIVRNRLGAGNVPADLYPNDHDRAATMA